MAHMNVNPGTKKINSNPRTALRKKRILIIVSKESPGNMCSILNVSWHEFYIKKSIDIPKAKTGVRRFLLRLFSMRLFEKFNDKKIRKIFYSRKKSPFFIL